MSSNADILILGGGAAGFFTAINIAETNPQLKIIILERGSEVLTKVRVSGGGRCNVTHAEFLPKALAENYPRGAKELLGPFHSFMTGDTIDWFSKRGVELKIEEDGRMFPVSNSSQTIIDCFLAETVKRKIEVLKNHSVKQLKKEEDGWLVSTTKGNFISDRVVVSTGSNTKIWQLLENLGHSIESAVPSLFTFNIKDSRISDLPGVATNASVKVIDTNGKAILESEGPLLVTHWGLSGPAILKLSAWGARILAPLEYRFQIRINWLYDKRTDSVLEDIKAIKISSGKKTVAKHVQFDLPKRLWQNLVLAAGISEANTWAELNNEQINKLSRQLTEGIFQVDGKSTFKEEFVTAGGVMLNEVNFKTFESRLHNKLYFAGEVLNIDAITGGFNFQNAWTGGFLVAKAITAQ